MDERLKELRKRLNYKGVEMAALLGVSSGNWSDWEKGRSKPGADALASIVKITGVSALWLLIGEGEIYEVKTNTAPSIWSLQDYQRQAAEEYYGNLTDEQVTLLDNYEKLTLPNRREMQGIIQLKLVTQLDGQLEGRAQGGTA